MKVIAVASQMQNGKSTIVDWLSVAISWQKVAFARKVKEIYCDAFGVDFAFIEKWKVVPTPPPGFEMPVRQGLQFIGDGFRKIMPTIWMDKCFSLNEPPMIIEDGRYINELNKVHENDGVNILAWRPGYENDDPNGSEAEIRPIVEWFKALPNNFEGSTEELFKSMSEEELAARPYGTDKINYFVRNKGTIQNLYAKLESDLVPYLQKKFIGLN